MPGIESVKESNAYRYMVEQVNIADQWVQQNTNGRHIGDVLESADNVATVVDGGMAVGGVALAIAGGTAAAPVLAGAAVGAGILVAYKAVKSAVLHQAEEMAAKGVSGEAVKIAAKATELNPVSKEDFAKRVANIADGNHVSYDDLSAAGKKTTARFEHDIRASDDKAVESFMRERAEKDMPKALESMSASEAKAFERGMHDLEASMKKEGITLSNEERTRLWDQMADSYKTPDVESRMVSLKELKEDAGKFMDAAADKRYKTSVDNAVEALRQQSSGRYEVLPGANEVKANQELMSVFKNRVADYHEQGIEVEGFAMAH